MLLLLRHRGISSSWSSTYWLHIPVAPGVYVLTSLSHKLAVDFILPVAYVMRYYICVII